MQGIKTFVSISLVIIEYCLILINYGPKLLVYRFAHYTVPRIGLHVQIENFINQILKSGTVIRNC